MRAIKFRGKSRKTGEWLVGDLLQVANEVFVAPSDGDWFDFIPWTKNNVFHLPSATYEVIPDTVGQFTGLRDKNGKEIYEGDVLSVLYNISLDRENVCVVYGGAGELSPGFYFSDDGTNDINHTWMFRDFINDGEVIGNIHDNPELLTLNK